MMKTCFALSMAMMLLSGCSGTPAAWPTIDGVVEPGEWRGAESYSTPSGMNVRIRRQDNLLFMVVSGPSAGYPTLFIAGPRSIEVLHASAALGSIAYHLMNGRWYTDSIRFVFDLRESATGKQPPDEIRMAYFQRHAWLSTSSTENSRVREFMIRLRPDEEYVAVSFIELPSLRIASWPDAADKGIRNRDILLGNVPDALQFDLRAWHRIDR